MAEFAASILGITAFGIDLTRRLYEFGCTASGAKEHTDYIARHVTLYASVLELLCDRISDEEPILSSKAYNLVEELSEQSIELFDRIKVLLPNREKDDLTFLEKIKWNFRKSRVEVLVAEIDYLKSTVHLLVTVLFTGKRIRSYRAKRRTNKNDPLHREHAGVLLQSMKAQNAIVDHLNASDKLHDMCKEEEPDILLLASDSAHGPTTPKCSDLVTKQKGAISRFKHSYESVEDPSERQALVLQDSGHILPGLLQQWTTLEPEQKNEKAPASSPNQANGADEIIDYQTHGNEHVETSYSAKSGKDSNELRDSYAFRKRPDDPKHNFQNANGSSKAHKPTRPAHRSSHEYKNVGAESADPGYVGQGPFQGGLRADHFRKKGKNIDRFPLDTQLYETISISCPWENCNMKIAPDDTMWSHIRQRHDGQMPSKAYDRNLPHPEMQPQKGILLRPTYRFPEESAFVPEEVAPLKDLTAEGLPPFARRTELSGALVCPKALEEGRERFEMRGKAIIVFGVLTTYEIQRLIERTNEIRAEQKETNRQMWSDPSSKEYTHRRKDRQRERAQQSAQLRRPAKEMHVQDDADTDHSTSDMFEESPKQPASGWRRKSEINYELVPRLIKDLKRRWQSNERPQWYGR